jgi:hypothetical protein
MILSLAEYSWRSLAFIVALAVVTASPAVRGDSFEVAPLPLPGPFLVACSNVVQDFNRVAAGESASDYWEGVPRSGGGSRYVTDLLADPANTLSVAVTAPSDSSLFGSFAGRILPYVILVCYPTTGTNPRPDYVLPEGKAVPHMQRGSEAPLLADPTTRYPLLLFSHGYGGSPISGDYIDVLLVLASFGVSLPRRFMATRAFRAPWSTASAIIFTFLRICRISRRCRRCGRCRCRRPSIYCFLDPSVVAHLDAAKIGGFGASQGGETLLLMAGAGLTNPSVYPGRRSPTTLVQGGGRLRPLLWTGYIPRLR